ncbi:MAG: hypothetical protein AAGA03_13015, partial [Planctomycetota bacterium]
ADLAPASWQVTNGNIDLVSAGVEVHSVPDASGSVKPQPCLVLRGQCPPGTAYRLRTRGLRIEGEDERCYRTHGQFVLRQWPVSVEDVEQSLDSVELISIDQFKLDAQTSGGHVVFPSSKGTEGSRAAVSNATDRVSGQGKKDLAVTYAGAQS